ncbi:MULTISPECIES: phosphoribosylglycinamide formyltransferase [Asticcacaulis]|uniref:phosphoribosylglycinamide formyltransferase n=1 Tax=Asticcacaulis TaxID=76890 RepID=UPI001AE1E1B6|nr:MULTISPECIES: phosphoribosylglycinamide formyltransferase [Asticcacaulis]MBP2158141.1 formyltetrahydrofolate-dependent phosphoribosylglycinamide formyltransferase [Asticcacaulis solisilvae]MDR6799186.1 formyltetrahydrofolate-dependent phosphoribosylglycinamide formyltransferase [Asticcacaulis sp. BE141]
MTSQKTKTAIFISGRGSNMMALVEAASAPDFPAEIALVVSNDPSAAGLAWAAERGIRTVAVDHRLFNKDREAHERAIHGHLTAHGVQFICLAGYMRILTPWLVETWNGRMINIHPALLPDFKGLHTHERAIEAAVAEHGATVHWVTPGVDEGETILQARVPVFPEDTADVLAKRVLAEEHKLYPEAVRLVLSKPLGEDLTNL